MTAVLDFERNSLSLCFGIVDYTNLKLELSISLRHIILLVPPIFHEARLSFLFFLFFHFRFFLGTTLNYCIITCSIWSFNVR